MQYLSPFCCIPDPADGGSFPDISALLDGTLVT